MSVMEQQEEQQRGRRGGVRRSFTGEFKADAVSMVLDDERKIIDVAQALGIIQTPSEPLTIAISVAESLDIKLSIDS